MTSIVSLIKGAVDLACISIGDLTSGECTVFVDEDSPETSIAVDLDHRKNPLGVNSVRCDFLYLAETEHFGYVVLLELSTHELKNFDHVKQQLQAGANYVQTLIQPHTKIYFAPTVVTNTIRKDQRAFLKNKTVNKVRLHKYHRPINWFSCGEKVSKILAKAEETQKLR